MKRWTDRELKYIQTHYEGMSDAEMAKKLGRTADAVEVRRLILNLRRRKGPKAEQEYTVKSRWDEVCAPFRALRRQKMMRKQG